MGVICRCIVRVGPMSGTPPATLRALSPATSPPALAPSPQPLSIPGRSSDTRDRWRSSMRTRSRFRIVGGGWMSSDRGPAAGLSSLFLPLAGLGLACSMEMLSVANVKQRSRTAWERQSAHPKCEHVMQCCASLPPPGPKHSAAASAAQTAVMLDDAGVSYQSKCQHHVTHCARALFNKKGTCAKAHRTKNTGLTSTEQFGGLLWVDATLGHSSCVPLLWAPAKQNKHRGRHKSMAERQYGAYLTNNCSMTSRELINCLVSKPRTSGTSQTESSVEVVLLRDCAILRLPPVDRHAASSPVSVRASRPAETDNAHALQDVHMGAAQHKPSPFLPNVHWGWCANTGKAHDKGPWPVQS